MSYKKAFSLLTIQLMLPLSSMTKEEYKDAYGIDLNDIDFEKVSLLQKEGSKEKYYVDEIKVTENGVDIYAGGKILSIGETSVSVTENAYSVENAKPLYIHPISIYKGNAYPYYSLSLFIFNNSPEKIDTLAKLENYIRELYTIAGESIRILVNGAYIESSENSVLVTSYLQKTSSEFALNVVEIDTKGPTSKNGATLSIIFGTPDVINDGVNKIN